MAKKSAKSKGYRKQQVKKPYLTKRDIVILCILVVAVIVAAAVLFNYDDGALKVADGRITGAGDNWLIVNGSATPGRARYFKVGEMGELEGYDRVNAPLADANVPQYVFTPQGEANGVDNISVTASHAGARKLADYIVETMGSLGSENLSQVTEAELNGQAYCYYTNVVEPAEEKADDAAGEEAAEAPEAEAADAAAEETADVPAEETADAPAEETADAPAEEGADAVEATEDAGEEAAEPAAEDKAPTYTATINAYMDCAHDSCVAVEVKTSADSREALPDEAALKALAEQALAVVALEPAK